MLSIPDSSPWPLPCPSLLIEQPSLVAALATYLGSLLRRGERLDFLDEQQQTQVLAAHLERLARYLLWEGAIREIVRAMAMQGIKSIPVKGMVMSELYYPDPGARPFCDLDLLVLDGQLDAARKAVILLGYEPFGVEHPRWKREHTHHLIFSRQGSPTVELHYLLTRELGCEGEIETFFKRATTTMLHDHAVSVLCPEDMLVYQLVHAASHGLVSGVYWALDLALVFRGHRALDQNRIVFDLERRRLKLAGAAALSLACDLFPSMRQEAASLLRRLGSFRSFVARKSVGSRWWVDSSDYPSARSLLVRAIMHERASDLLKSLRKKVMLNLTELKSRLLKRDLQ